MAHGVFVRFVYMYMILISTAFLHFPLQKVNYVKYIGMILELHIHDMLFVINKFNKSIN